MNKKVVLQILLPILILAAISGIWIIKNNTGLSSGLSSETPLEISSLDLDDLKAAHLPAIIDFGSDSCLPCLEMAPVLKKMNIEMQGKAIIHFINTQKHSEAAQDFPIRVIPTQVFYTADGKPYRPSEEIQNSIAFTLYQSKATNEHVFTVHEGGLTEEEFRSILKDMGVN